MCRSVCLVISLSALLVAPSCGPGAKADQETAPQGSEASPKSAETPADGFRLALRFEKGDEFRYRETQEIKEGDKTTRFSGIAVLRVQEVSPEGTARLVQSMEGGTIAENGNDRPMPDRTGGSFSIDSRGTVTNVTGGIAARSGPVFPGRAVDVGDSWTGEVAFPIDPSLPQAVVRGEAESRLKSVTDTASGPMAEIVFEGKFSLPRAEFTMGLQIGVDLSPDAQSGRGAMVNEAVPDSPAAEAGFESGDLIVRFRDVPIATIRELQDAVRASPADQPARVLVMRDGKQQELTVTPRSAGTIELGATASTRGRYELDVERGRLIREETDALDAEITVWEGESSTRRTFHFTGSRLLLDSESQPKPDAHEPPVQ